MAVAFRLVTWAVDVTAVATATSVFLKAVCANAVNAEARCGDASVRASSQCTTAKGATVGLGEGGCKGWGEGDGVGSCVGRTDGGGLGRGDGGAVGAVVGLGNGGAVGLGEGNGSGAWLGAEVGRSDGGGDGAGTGGTDG